MNGLGDLAASLGAPMDSMFHGSVHYGAFDQSRIISSKPIGKTPGKEKHLPNFGSMNVTHNPALSMPPETIMNHESRQLVNVDLKGGGTAEMQ